MKEYDELVERAGELVPITEPDPGDKPLSIHENYYKARRNTLLWSSLAIVACFGYQAGDKAPTMGGFGLAFPQAVVIGAALGAAAYMFLGFLRERRSFELNNSPSFFQAEAADLRTIFKRLSHEAKRLVHNVSDAHSKVDQVKGQLGTARLEADKFDREVLSVADEIGRLMGSIEKQRQRLRTQNKPPEQRVDAYDRDFDHLHQTAALWCTTLSRVGSTLSADIEAAQTTINGAETVLDEFNDVTLPYASEIEAIRDQLFGFHSSIAEGEQKWDRWLDKIAPRGLFIFAVVAAIVRVPSLPPFNLY